MYESDKLGRLKLGLDSVAWGGILKQRKGAPSVLVANSTGKRLSLSFYETLAITGISCMILFNWSDFKFIFKKLLI